jgi:hypothetical protein
MAMSGESGDPPANACATGRAAEREELKKIMLADDNDKGDSGKSPDMDTGRRARINKERVEKAILGMQKPRRPAQARGRISES